MSSRRERPPTGRVNQRPSTAQSVALRPLTARPQTSSSARSRPPFQQDTSPVRGNTSYRGSDNNNQSNPASSRPCSSMPRPGTGSARAGSGLNALCSARSQESELSTSEVMRRMREKSEAKKNEIDEKEIAALGDYNAFSRPRKSEVAPLRTAFLDPAVNNFPRSRTRTELIKRIKSTGMPHFSYDLDNDGYVSQEDFRLAKRFDFDGNGLLDPDERHVGKHILAEEFFRAHEKDIANYGSSFAQNTRKQNIDKLVNAYSFERTYGKLKQVERTLTAESSKPLIDCIRNDTDEVFQRNKYHTNKFDSTAWTDYDRVPRSSWMGATLTEEEHQGSRRRLLFARREQSRRECQDKFDTESMLATQRSVAGRAASPHATVVRTLGRINLISDIRVENS